jgi:hypothetical protein
MMFPFRGPQWDAATEPRGVAMDIGRRRARSGRLAETRANPHSGRAIYFTVEAIDGETSGTSFMAVPRIAIRGALGIETAAGAISLLGQIDSKLEIG